MTCHGNPNVERAPLPSAIREMTPERIYEALTNGVMKAQGQSLSDPEKRTLALFMSGRPVGSMQQGDAKNMPNQCSSNPPLSDPAAGPAWNGWGVNETNTRFQSAKNAGLTAADVPKLKLKWAFGYPTGVSAFGQPTIASGRIFVGTDIGYVYSLDAKTGCVYWSFQTKGSVRNAISIGPVKHAYGQVRHLLRRRPLQRLRGQRADRRRVVDRSRRPALHRAHHRGADAVSEPALRAGVVLGRILRVHPGLSLLHFPRQRGRL